MLIHLDAIAAMDKVDISGVFSLVKIDCVQCR